MWPQALYISYSWWGFILFYKPMDILHNSRGYHIMYFQVGWIHISALYVIPRYEFNVNSL